MLMSARASYGPFIPTLSRTHCLVGIDGYIFYFIANISCRFSARYPRVYLLFRSHHRCHRCVGWPLVAMRHTAVTRK